MPPPPSQMLPWVDSMSCCTASADGTVKLVDLETGCSRTLLDINPDGWVQVSVEVWRCGGVE